MLFQVINGIGIPVMSTEFASCIPDDEQLSSMYNAGYKFKLDGKTITKKKAKEIRDENTQNN